MSKIRKDKETSLNDLHKEMFILQNKIKELDKTCNYFIFFMGLISIACFILAYVL